MAEPGPSAPIARTTLMPELSIDRLGIARTPSSQPTLSVPHTIHNNSNISGGTVNNVHGDLHTNYYTSPPVVSINPASPPTQSLLPFNNAPIDRISSCFIGREPELEFISSSFRSSQSDKPTRLVIYGMPGLGKSQLALQHANLAFASRDYSHIFWVSASTSSSLSQGLTRILVLVNHPDRSHPDQAVQLAAVCLWLEQSDSHGCLRWLLILDNATAESAMFLREHLPRQNASGSILITTRTAHIAESVANTAGQEHRVFELKALSRAQSVNLLLRRAGIQNSAPIDLESAEKLVARVGCLPLAVEQAGSYMKRSGIKSANQLQRMYDERGVNEVLSWENNMSAYEEKSVLGAINVQLQSLDEINPDAHKLVKALAFFDPENIPLDILSLGARKIRKRIAKNVKQSHTIVTPAPGPKVPAIRMLLKRLKGKEPKPPISDTPAAMNTIDPLEGVPSELRGLVELICSEERMRAVFRHLEDLSIAQPLYDSRPSLHVHDLIQLVLQQSTMVHREEGYRNLAIALLCNAFRTIDDPEQPQSWDECERYVPHFAALAAQDETHPVTSEEYLHANESIANYFYSRGRYSEAKTLLKRVLSHRRRLLGGNNGQTVSVMYSIARVYERLGRFQEAESLFAEVLAADEKQLGVDHLNTLSTVSSLAGIYSNQKKFNEAEKLYARALAGKEKQLRADHPSTLATVHNLANLYKTQRKFDEAEKLYGRVLAEAEKQRADHPNTLITVRCLAGVYERQGKFDEAEKLYARALAGQEQQLGADHLRTLSTVHSLAGLYESKGKFNEAEKLYMRALAGRERQLGVDHPRTLTVIHNFAYLRKLQGRPQEAEVLYRRALIGYEAKLGSDHPDTLGTLTGLAKLYKTQGRYEEAKELKARVAQSKAMSRVT